MTLKEKFEKIFIEEFTSDWEKECEKIADEFAIGFAEWLLKKYNGVKSVKELLEIYKKEKGL